MSFGRVGYPVLTARSAGRLCETNATASRLGLSPKAGGGRWSVTMIAVPTFQPAPSHPTGRAQAGRFGELTGASGVATIARHDRYAFR